MKIKVTPNTFKYKLGLRKIIEDLNKTNEQLDFKLKVMQEKEKIHDNSYHKIQDMQSKYDEALLELKEEFMKKEAIMKEKYEQMEFDLKINCDEKINENNENYEKIIKQAEKVQGQHDEVFII